MPTVAFVSSKGGSGKSVCATAVAVTAAKGHDVFLLDLDPQQSLAAWRRLRGGDAMRLVETRSGKPAGIPADAWLIVDTPNNRLDVMREWISRADAVVVVMKPGGFDLASIVATEKLIEETKAGRKVLRVLNDFEPKVAFHNEVLGHLHGLHKVRPFIVQHRPQYGAATVTGHSAVETVKAAREEIDKIWQEIKSRAAASGLKATA